jgi:hypothetical protein
VPVRARTSVDRREHAALIPAALSVDQPMRTGDVLGRAVPRLPRLAPDCGDCLALALGRRDARCGRARASGGASVLGSASELSFRECADLDQLERHSLDPITCGPPR